MTLNIQKRLEEEIVYPTTAQNEEVKRCLNSFESKVCEVEELWGISNFLRAIARTKMVLRLGIDASPFRAEYERSMEGLKELCEDRTISDGVYNARVEWADRE